ncbi:MAG: sodium-dependent transporter [Myxococcota bacterium]|jgi:SNF family Na+-dependent transporter|nr:sodium-dependent transporter [Myxococcota bacterium]
MSQQKQGKEQWGTRLGVVLAVAGSAVGLGNFLRFPGQVSQNGGGAFMIPYFIAMVLIAVPLCWVEWTTGKRGGVLGFNSGPGILSAVSRHHPAWRAVGLLGVLVPLLIYMYYVLIEAWCSAYAWDYASGAMAFNGDGSGYAAQSIERFSTMTGQGAHGEAFGWGEPLLFWVIVFGLNFGLLYFGISKGIEVFCRYAIPLMSVCAIIVLVRVLTLGTPNPEVPEQNIVNGLGFMWNPRSSEGSESWLSVLAEPSVWLAATGQIFFSLSVGFGVIINYASYLKRRSDTVLSGLTAASTNEFFEVGLGGMITIPAAFIFLGAAGAVGGTFGLGFITLPVVFAHMPGGQFFGALWFFMLFLAAITSSLSMLQPVIAFLEEGLGLKRKASVALLGAISAGGSALIFYYSKGLGTLDTVDFWVGTFMIFVLATLQIILFSWVWGADEAIDFANDGSAMNIPRIFRFILKFVSPTYLLIIFLMWSSKELPERWEALLDGEGPIRIALGLIAAVSALFVVLLVLSVQRWKKQGLVPRERLPGRVSTEGWLALILAVLLPPVGSAYGILVYNRSKPGPEHWKDTALKGMSIVIGLSMSAFGVLYAATRDTKVLIRTFSDSNEMTTAGWVFMLVSLLTVIALVAFSYGRIMRSPSEPDEAETPSG